MKKAAKIGVVAPAVPFPRPTLWLLLMITLLALAGCATTPVLPPVTVPQIIEMSQAGVPADQIIEKIADSGTIYRLKASQFADLEKKGVSSSVINYMQEKYIEAVRREQAITDWNRWTPDNFGYWYGGCPYGWSLDWCR